MGDFAASRMKFVKTVMVSSIFEVFQREETFSFRLRNNDQSAFCAIHLGGCLVEEGSNLSEVKIIGKWYHYCKRSKWVNHVRDGDRKDESGCSMASFTFSI